MTTTTLRTLCLLFSSLIMTRIKAHSLLVWITDLQVRISEDSAHTFERKLDLLVKQIVEVVMETEFNGRGGRCMCSLRLSEDRAVPSFCLENKSLPPSPAVVSKI